MLSLESDRIVNHVFRIRIPCLPRGKGSEGSQERSMRIGDGQQRLGHTEPSWKRGAMYCGVQGTGGI